MLHPSYTELMEKINKEGETGEEPVINSRYSIVIATSKRAREIIGGDEPLVNGMEGEKPLSIAVKELYDSKIKILPGDEENMEDEEHLSSEEFEELGEVEIKMTMENNIMKAQFVVESQTVKDILESRFDNLRNALENKGFYGAEINVSVSTGENKNANNAFTFNQSDNKRTEEKVPDYLAKVENLENNSKVRKVISDSNVDIMI